MAPIVGRRSLAYPRTIQVAIATGAGAVSRQALGTAVLGGMLGATILGAIFTPVLYVVLQWRKNP